MNKSKYIFIVGIFFLGLSSATSGVTGKVTEHAIDVWCRVQFDAVKEAWSGNTSANKLVDESIQHMAQSGYAMVDYSMVEDEFRKRLTKFILTVRKNKQKDGYDKSRFISDMRSQFESCKIRSADARRMVNNEIL